jgi:signal transduction histidine kinase/CheY-like chemotaxis protein
MAVFAVAGAYLLAEREREAFERGAIERVRALLTAVDAELRGSVTTLEAMAVLPDLDAPNIETFRSHAERIVATQPNWINLVVARPTGEHILNLLVPPGQPLPPSQDHATARRAAESRRSVVGDMVSGAVLKRPVFTVRTPVIRGGETRLVLSAVLDPSSIKRLLDRQGFSDEWVAAVIDGNFRFVARTHAAPGANDEASASLRQALTSSREGWLAGQTLEGMAAYRAFARSSFSDWSVSMAVPRTAVYRSGREAALLLALGVLLAMAAGVALAVVLARRISSPIASLAAAAPRLGQGEPSAAPPPTNVDEVRDLTAALQDAGRAIREREAALRAADRAKDEFLAMLGHELRNPLATLSTAAELLKVGRGQPGVLDSAQQLIARQSAQMTHLVNDLLEVGRVTGGKIDLDKAPMDLAEIAARVAATWRSAGRLERRRLEESYEPAWILADAARIEQIVSNLIDNAVKYTPEGGRVALRVRRAGGQAFLEVSDDGQGLVPELIDRVFDLFVQGERGLARQQGGLGIGLTMVKRLAELHEGTAKASSAGPGRGATFTVAFPAIEPQAASSATRSVGAPVERRRILIIDDNRDARESLAQLLVMAGHEVRTAKDGAEGLHLLAAEPPDVALVDIGLPDMSGYEVASRIRARPEGSRVVLAAVTGYGRQQDREASRQAGFDAHLTKPVEMRELEHLLSQASSVSSGAAIFDFPRRRA